MTVKKLLIKIKFLKNEASEKKENIKSYEDKQQIFGS